MNCRARRWKAGKCLDCFLSAKLWTSPANWVAITCNGPGPRAPPRAGPCDFVKHATVLAHGRRSGRPIEPEGQLQPDLRLPPPTECFRDSFPREDSSAPCCVNFFPPRRSRLPRKAFFSGLFFFLLIAAQ